MRTAQQLASPVAGLIQGVGKSALNVLKPPQMLTEQERWQRMLDVAGAEGGPALGGILKQIGPKILQTVKQHPREVMTLLSSLGLLGSTASTSQAVDVPGVVGVTDDFDTAKAKLQSAITELEKKLESAKSPTKITTASGRQIERGGTDPGTIKQWNDRKALLQQQLDAMLEQEKPFLEKHPDFPDEMIGLGGALGTLMGFRGIQQATRAGKPLSGFQKAGGPGLLVGLPEAALAFGVPEGADIRGVGRAKHAADKETWTDLLKRFGIELAEAGGASGVGYKLGSMALPSPVKKTVPAIPDGGAPPLPASPATDIVKQIAREDPLAAMKSIKPPAATPPQDEIVQFVPKGHPSGFGGRRLPGNGVRVGDIEKVAAERGWTRDRRPRVGKVAPGETEPAAEPGQPRSVDQLIRDLGSGKPE